MKIATNAATMASAAASEVLDIAVVYEDAFTQKWAWRTCQLPAKIVGPERINYSWWESRFLNDPAVFAEALGAASIADIVAISVHSAEELPPELLAWIDAWLPRRQPRPGAMVALIGVPEESPAQAAPTREYLRAVARKGSLDFVTCDLRYPAHACGLAGSHLASRYAHAPLPELWRDLQPAKTGMG